MKSLRKKGLGVPASGIRPASQIQKFSRLLMAPELQAKIREIQRKSIAKRAIRLRLVIAAIEIKAYAKLHNDRARD